ncbi:protein kinase domain-containing protein [Urbifossiella limnaea]|uniref:Serine/threonine-protein kinase PknB n=1 Tax=Urbifossiella limnaea TaxID=2528023 RepID=A0A517XRZ2_9BACT|nr:FtsK/SpoIIIE domain-containing protein [Urbifossiella limnaea]QDU20274.1 Serine/threonine-protein kinase PknB [Urbifossiella limnaea]
MSPSPSPDEGTVVLPAAAALRSAAAADATPAVAVPGFELLEVLSHGGMGVVYRARETALDRVVALKMIAPAALAMPDVRERFEREARAAARLQHPNVVALYHTGLDAPCPFLVLEYVPGFDLVRLVRERGSLPWREAVEYARLAAQGLRHVHECGLVHRDVKPSNVMVVPADGAGPASVKLLDLGVARLVLPASHPSDSALTEAGVFLGTPEYVAPEQAEDPRRADARSDLYGLGATLYFLLSGAPPFSGQTPLEAVRRAATDPRPSLRGRRPDVPAALDVVVRRLLAADPARRFASAADVADALGRVLRGEPLPPELSDPTAVHRPTGTSRMAANQYDRLRTALARLADAAKARAAAEAAAAAAFREASDRADRELGRAKKSLAAAREKEQAAIEENYTLAVTDLNGRADAELYAATRTRDERLTSLSLRYTSAEQKGRTEYQDKLWALDSVLEGSLKRAADQKESLGRKAAAAEEQVAGLWAEAGPLVEKAGTSREAVSGAAAAAATDDDPITRVQKAIAAAEDAIGTLRKDAGGKLFVLLGSTRRRLLAEAEAVGARLGEAEAAVAELKRFAAAEYAAETERAREKHARKRREAQEHYEPLLATQKEQYEAERARIGAEFEAAATAVRSKRGVEGATTESDYKQGRRLSAARNKAELKAAEETHEDKIGYATEARDAAWERLSAAWHGIAVEATTTLIALRAEAAADFPDWATVAGGRALPTTVPGGIRYGVMAVDPHLLPDGVSADARLAPPPDLAGPTPAFLPFPDRCSVVLKARDDGRAAAVAALQAMMLRFLTGLPPGKVRFTIVDPVGLGDNFASFMHLADHDEKLVTGRIWTEPREIEARLTDLTDHVASVIQKYLRNQYKSIEEYNRVAGEVAEPYRVLVVANFPANFSPEAAKRLVSIAQSGPSCGVCVLVGVDARAAMPRDFVLSDLEAPSLVLNWKDGRFSPKEPALAPFPLTVDAPPDAATVAQLVRRVGQASKDAVRVEVPFEYIAPKPDEVWTKSAAKGFDVPVGRAGATRRQAFVLGRGTAQHALVAGKTGSGKSTLLHALITNLALNYSPDEAELYLIDFKEGVEFQWYATYQLPHARVVAIQSEREFGLSVLQRLDGILRERGERFRDAGVNDLAGYREFLKGQATCPRILLVVDEFQQFFVEDDKLAQEAALLLDRLVRQGRAFGLHVLLGSQTLGGAYSLARSTIDQMAVRVALQCSDADAQLILSKDNNAARLLSRPGEAIYNDQNGLVEGNDPFQVVWLSEEKRESVLRELGRRAAGKYPPPLVFEGNSDADPARNPALARVLAAETWAEPKAPAAWLGDPVAIKEPTVAVFRPQGSANLLLIGQNEDAARGLFAAALLGLAGQIAPAGTPVFTLLDGTPDDADDAETLRRLAAKVPGHARAPDRPALPAAIAELAAEVERRAKGEGGRAPRFLFVFGVHRFRELRKAEDDYSFSRRGAEREPSPAERFAALLKDGPGVGVHVVAWCDSLTNLNRAFDRSLLREFGMRVLFQMSPTDSSTLMDSPAASRLGRHRALFLQEEQERPEKFRPYGVPEAGWVDAAVVAVGKKK